MLHSERLYAVRGAVCCENTEESIGNRIPELYRTLVDRNGIDESAIVSIQFSVNRELTVHNPATALRRSGCARDIPLFCAAEPYVDGYLENVIRILVTYYGNRAPVSVYLYGAEVLRPDLFVTKTEDPSASTRIDHES